MEKIKRSKKLFEGKKKAPGSKKNNTKKCLFHKEKEF